MLPLRLELVNFIGIRDGLGRDEFVLDLDTDDQLIALTGETGRGKTTILDNLHPYRIMPSRATDYGEGSFSFAQEVYAPAGDKTLIWSQEGVKYKSVIVIDISKKVAKQSAYLFTESQISDQQWIPTERNEIRSDGKTSTYDALIHDILGSPSLFFSTAFSCQARKMLVDYGNADIKALMSELLGHNHVLALYRNANDVLRGLRPVMQGYCQTESEMARMTDQLKAGQEQMTELQSKIDAYGGAFKELTETHETAQKEVMRLEVEWNAARKKKEEKQLLTCQLNKLIDESREAIHKKRQDHTAERNKTAARLTAFVKQHDDMQARQSLSASTLDMLRGDIDNYNALIYPDDGPSEEQLIELAGKEERQIEKIKELEEHEAQRHLEVLDHERQLANIDAIAQQMAHERRMCLVYDRQAELSDNVPCVGTEYNAKCMLLADSNKAKDSLEAANAEIATLDGRLAAAQEKAGTHKTLEDKSGQLGDAKKSLAIYAKARNDLHELAQNQIRKESAERRKRDLQEQMENDKRHADELDKDIQTVKADLADIELANKTALTELSNDYNHRVHDLQIRIDSIIIPDSGDLEAAQNAERQASQQKQHMNDMLKTTNDKLVELTTTINHKREAMAALEKQAIKAKALSTTISEWELTAKGIGPDGIIALSIDDAGPAISAIANDIMMSCYGSRYTVSIETQRTLKTGAKKEQFQVRVWDAETNESKMLQSMSGGQKVYVTEAIFGAMGIYQKEAQEIQYHCRFSDESDGALDHGKKIEFVKMKRELLKKGGYDREIFISHTPELWSLADRRIDLDELYVGN